MKIVFLKDHLGYKSGDACTDHPNAAYLVTLGVAEEVAREKIDKPGNQKEKVDMVNPATKKRKWIW